MAAKYLLSCSCGAEHVVSTHQAGSQIACGCGKRVDVPQLRKLSQLPQRVDAQPAASRRWGLRESLATAGGVATLVLLVAAAWMAYSVPEIPQFPADQYLQTVDEQLEQATPRQLWQRWAYEYQYLPDEGFQEFRSSEREHLLALAQQRRLYRNVWLLLAGVVAGLTAIAYFAVRPTERG